MLSKYAFAPVAPVIAPTHEEMAQRMLATPSELFRYQYEQAGAPRPSYLSPVIRVPWETSRPPYYIAQTAPGGPNEKPTERLYNLMINTQEHEREDLAGEMYASQTHYARKRGQATWQAFDRELAVRDVDGKLRATQHQGFQWLPPNPTDSDWNEAALIAKQLPPNPALFAPDGSYMTAPGLSWRFGDGQTH